MRALPLLLMTACASQTYRAGEVEIEARREGDRLLMRVSWPDATKNAVHKPWVWKEGAYTASSEREDMVELSFAEGTPRPVLDGKARDWDVWHWKAFRSNVAGYAIDKRHRYFTADPGGDSHRYGDVWAIREEDEGTNVQKKLPRPAAYAGDVVPQFAHDVPTGSLGDVHARGAWADGRWTVEFERALDTGHSDDVVFVPGRTYALGVTTFDQRGHEAWTPDEVVVIEFRVP